MPHWKKQFGIELDVKVGNSSGRPRIEIGRWPTSAAPAAG